MFELVELCWTTQVFSYPRMAVKSKEDEKKVDRSHW